MAAGWAVGKEISKMARVERTLKAVQKRVARRRRPKKKSVVARKKVVRAKKSAAVRKGAGVSGKTMATGRAAAKPKRTARGRGAEATRKRAAKVNRTPHVEGFAVASVFPELANVPGVAGAVLVAERVGDGWEYVTRRLVAVGGGDRGFRIGEMPRNHRDRNPAGRAVRSLVSRQVCRVLTALGHVDRVRILTKLLSGPGTYQAIQRFTGLKPGPLYHHVRELREAGLLMPKERDLYELTRAGRNAILTAAAMAPMVKDMRRRPLPIG